MSAASGADRERRVGFLGPEGTFTAEAARRAAPDQERVPLPTIEEVFGATRRGEVDTGVVPIENLIEGSVNATLDELAFGDGGLYVRGEVVVPVSLHLLARPGVEFAQLTKVRSQPHALAQARGWLTEHLPEVTQDAATSTAEAARQVAETADAPEAAIGTLLAAERFGLAVLASDIHRHTDNATRFFVLGTTMPTATGSDKTSVVIWMGEDRPGLLLSILDEFALRGINLSKIESRPAKTRMGEYVIFLDAIGHVDEPRLAGALSSVYRHVADVRVLGTYPRADQHPTHIPATESPEAYAKASAWVQTIRDDVDGGPA